MEHSGVSDNEAGGNRQEAFTRNVLTILIYWPTPSFGKKRPA